MIDLASPSKIYADVKFLVPSTPKQKKMIVRPMLRYETSSRIERSMTVGLVTNLNINLAAISKMTLDEFVENFENYRNELAEKKIRDQKLSISEKFELTTLNKRLDELIGYKKPKEITDALELLREAKRQKSFMNR